MLLRPNPIPEVCQCTTVATIMGGILLVCRSIHVGPFILPLLQRPCATNGAEQTGHWQGSVNGGASVGVDWGGTGQITAAPTYILLKTPTPEKSLQDSLELCQQKS